MKALVVLALVVSSSAYAQFSTVICASESERYGHSIVVAKAQEALNKGIASILIKKKVTVSAPAIVMTTDNNYAYASVCVTVTEE